MTNGGFAGTVLDINLTLGEIKKIPLDLSLAGKFGGGLGLTIKLACDRITPHTDPMSPENPVVIGAGPFVGTSIPGCSRIYGVSRFPGSGTIGWCGGGGGVFGCFLKNAGYDHIIITGKAPGPVYIKIIDDDVELCDASHLWGKGIEKTCGILWSRYTEPAGVIAIGQAGENKVTFSMASVDRHSSLGRGGFGAVLGSKNLKAILVRGTKGIRVADKKSYRALNGALLTKIREYPHLKEWQDMGLLKSLPIVPKEKYHEIKIRRIACVSCPIGDKDVVKITAGGSSSVRCTSSAANLFMPLLYGFKDFQEAAKCIAVLDEYGLDMFEFFGIMSFAKDLSAGGIISARALEDEIDLSSLSSMERWAQKISLREGLGNIFADGFRGISEHFGEEAGKFTPYTFKGMLTYVGPRGPVPWNLFGTMELGQILDHRGPHIASGGSPTYFAKREPDAFLPNMRRMGIPEETIGRIMTRGESPSRDLKIGRLLRYSHQWFSILGSLGICARAQINRFYDAQLCAALYEAVTGIKTGTDDLKLRADRAWTLLRAANVNEGHLRNDSEIPDKWFEDPAFRDYMSGQAITRDAVARMVDDYYAEQGWEISTGIPLKARLVELGLPAY